MLFEALIFEDHKSIKNYFSGYAVCRKIYAIIDKFIIHNALFSKLFSYIYVSHAL